MPRGVNTNASEEEEKELCCQASRAILVAVNKEVNRRGGIGWWWCRIREDTSPARLSDSCPVERGRRQLLDKQWARKKEVVSRGMEVRELSPPSVLSPPSEQTQHNRRKC